MDSNPVMANYQIIIVNIFIKIIILVIINILIKIIITIIQGVLSWRASGNRQISLSASDERAFANFRVKNVVFTGTHFCAVLSMVGERAFVNFRKFVN